VWPWRGSICVGNGGIVIAFLVFGECQVGSIVRGPNVWDLLSEA
jgi:hypothetical protein